MSARTTWRVVRLHGSDGATGLGEYSDAGPAGDALWPSVAARLADGVPVAELTARPDGHRGTGDPAARLAEATVRGALDLAAADLAARRAGQPLWRWLGGDGPRPVARYANINRALRRRTPEEFAEVARAAVAAGYRAVKCAPFDGIPVQERLRAGLARAVAVRRAVPSAELMVDVHHLLTPCQVEGAAPELRALDLRWLEDAVPLDDPEALAAVHGAGIAPLAGGEFATRPGEVAPALARLAWLLPDVKHAGGFGPARRLAEAALAAGVGVSLHNPAGPVATAAGLHLAAALGPGVETEFAFGEAPWRASAVRPPEAPDGPWLLPPDGPGLGLELDPARWTATPVRPGRAPGPDQDLGPDRTAGFDQAVGPERAGVLR
ncbi:enolase C-terminal domain-like protein [Kitasatospora sp. NPDC058170]|uniref:enolase C-terminal domain-like protein n=1 Tax=Kitasatospora sp. NPDC058170 TaxID=3346364 RepID=UPI0036DB3B0F